MPRGGRLDKPYAGGLRPCCSSPRRRRACSIEVVGLDAEAEFPSGVCCTGRRRSTASIAVAARPSRSEATPRRTVVLYDDFSGGSASYTRKWLIFYSLERQFGARNLPAFSRSRLRLFAKPFRGWMDETCA